MRRSGPWDQNLPKAVTAGLWATALYAVVLHTLEVLGYSLSGYWVPTFCYHYWAVFPGSVVLSQIVLRARSGPWRSALFGALLAPWNAPFSVLVILVNWEISARLGLTDPWRYGFSGLWGEWINQFWTLLLAGAPVAVICGAVMGYWLGQPQQPTKAGPPPSPSQ